MNKSAISRWPKQFLKWVLYGLVFLAIAVVLFYMVENWRGARAWEKAQEDLKSAGVSIDFKDYIPPEVPDAENFCRLPVIVALMEAGKEDRGSATEEQKKIYNDFKAVMQHQANFNGSWRKGEVGDVELTEDVLQSLKNIEPHLAELKEAAKRPYARFPVDYDKRMLAAITLPHISLVIFLSEGLNLYGIASLESGNSQAALEVFEIQSSVFKAIDTEPFLVSALIRAGMTDLQMVWHGMKNRQWRAGELERMQEVMEGWDMPTVFRRAITVDLAVIGMNSLNLIEADKTMAPAFRAIPAGWYDRNRALLGNLALGGHQAGDNRKWLEWAKASEEHVKQTSWKSGLFVKFITVHFHSMAKNSLVVQAAIDQAETACALERYYIDKGDYPATLEMLVPEYMSSVPLDVMDEKPLRYARTEDGRYKIYSVGLDGVDDGGVRGAGGKKEHPRNARDWVWSYETDSEAGRADVFKQD